MHLSLGAIPDRADDDATPALPIARARVVAVPAARGALVTLAGAIMVPGLMRSGMGLGAGMSFGTRVILNLNNLRFNLNRVF